MNGLIPQKQNLPATNDDIDPFQEVADETASRAHITGSLLRFTKHGKYKAGQEQEEVEENTRMLVYMPGLKRGWVKWQDGAPVRHMIGLVAERYTPPPREELGDLDEDEWGQLNGRPIDPWQKTYYLVMLDENGDLYTFVTSSKGGISAIGVLSDAFSKRRRMKPDEIPVIELRARSYDHKDYGETFAPDLHITGWAKIPANFAELATAMDDGDEVSDESVAFGATPKAIAAPKSNVKSAVKAAPKASAKTVAAGKSKTKNGPGKSVRF